MYTPEFEKYRDEVVSSFASKREEAKHDWLIRPTRARIRQLTLEIIENGVENRDEINLRNVFQMSISDRDYRKAAKDMVADDFKSLELFLNDPQRITSEKNVEFMAWIINFPDRPFSNYKTRGKAPVKPPDEIKPEIGVEEPAPRPQELVKPELKISRWLIAEAAVLLLGLCLQFQIPERTRMYVCDSPGARRYHLKTTCSGLNRCTSRIIQIDAEDAKKRGLTVCKFESRL